MSLAAVAERYARALFEVGVESGELDDIVERVRELAEAYRASPELRSVLDNPLVEQDKRDAMLSDVAARARLEGPALNAIRLLAKRHKLAVLSELASKLRDLADEKAGIVRATVTSAVALPESFYQRLQQELETATSRRIVLERREDASLIAGVVTRIGDNTIDGSVRGQLAEIERQLRSP